MIWAAAAAALMAAAAVAAAMAAVEQAMVVVAVQVTAKMAMAKEVKGRVVVAARGRVVAWTARRPARPAALSAV